nr:ras-interacting protein RIP3 [Drosophila suzukii]
MESQGKSESLDQNTKTTEENVAKCCFVVTVGSDGLIEISSHNPDSQAPQDEINSGNPTSTNQVSDMVSKKQRFSIAVLKEDSNDSDEGPAKSPEKINTNLQSLDGEKKTEVVPPFVKICNKDLANRPSFVVLEDALERNRIKQDLEQPNIEQCQKSSHAESQTGETCSKKSTTSTNNVSQRDNAIAPLRKLSTQTAVQVRQKLSTLNNKQPELVSESMKRAGNSLIVQKQQQHQPLQQQTQQQQQQHQQLQQQQLQQQFGNNSPYVTLSFLPMTQPGATSSSPVMYPCQQFLSATPSSMSSCSCCSCSNCCPPRATHVCQLPMGNGCCQIQNPVYGSNCCMLKPENFPNSGSCCPISNMEAHPSMGFNGQFSQHMMHPILTTSPSALQQQQTNIPVAGGFYPGCSCHSICPCNQCSHHRMQTYHHPCCHCPGFFNSQQMHQMQQQQLQQQQQSQSICCPIKVNQQQHSPSKGVRVLKATGKPTNRDGLKHIFSNKPAEIPKPPAQEQAKDQEDHQSHKKTSREAPRSIGGVSSIKGNSNTTPLYLARYGKTCLILRPISTAIMPRLLTKRISRYTSVIAWPTNNIKSNVHTN